MYVRKGILADHDITTVSYTHLDVYKRQILYVLFTKIDSFEGVTNNII